MFSITKKVKMKKICCFNCGKHRKSKNLQISNIFEETLVLSIICSKSICLNEICLNEDEKIFKKEESIELLKIIDLIKSI